MYHNNNLRIADHSDNEAQSLRRCLRDLVALSALPSIWIGLGPAEIVRSLTDVLIRVLRVDLVYVSLKVSDTGDVYEAARASGHPKEACGASAIGKALAPWLEPQSSTSPITISNPIGAGRLHMFSVPIAHGSEYGVVCVCSRLAGFPTEMDRLLCSVTCNQAATALCKYAVFPAPLAHIADKLARSELHHAVEYIHDNLGNDLSLRKIANAAGISTNYFASLFKQTTGQSPHQYVIRQRIEKAKPLLRRSDLSIGEIALQVGFYDSSHLTRHFKRLTGLTPRTLRKGS